ncbi:hypothetical protein [Acinetobacter phage Ab69]|nr:hypothetical protein [Acinetobacter phage Ab69]
MMCESFVEKTCFYDSEYKDKGCSNKFELLMVIL